MKVGLSNSYNSSASLPGSQMISVTAGVVENEYSGIVSIRNGEKRRLRGVGTAPNPRFLALLLRPEIGLDGRLRRARTHSPRGEETS